MLKSNRRTVILSSIVILLPVLAGLLLWNRLPDQMATHWSTSNTPDGFSSKAFAVFGIPVFLLIMHFFCLLATAGDAKQKDQNKKVLGMVFWIIPLVSLFTNGMIYAAALEKEFHVLTVCSVMMGLLFLFLGNYFPKIKQNRTIGIRFSWTLNNEENWNRTHRFAGKVWVIDGLVLLLSIFLPGGVLMPVLFGTIVVAVVLPFLYSWRIYREQKEGSEL
ncbi:MAG: SdpI family protein [Lachnospiraceae bacterium]|nr:SdpI family protein [Lachnospiraceae bacterium]